MSRGLQIRRELRAHVPGTGDQDAHAAEHAKKSRAAGERGPYLRRVTRPTIGMPTCLDDRERWRAGRAYSYMDRAYADAVDAAGGAPLQLPIQRDAAARVAGIDALLLPGGDDFLPEGRSAERYPPELPFDPVPAEQLAFDRALLAAALARGIPVLGICYGMQLLALEAGGALHYHLPRDLPDAGVHTLPERDGRHAIAIDPESRLARIVGAAHAEVNSLHHQAVRDPGRGLRAVARGSDGVVEALERDRGQTDAESALVLGVQWHPEKLEGPAGASLFEELVETARTAPPR